MTKNETQDTTDNAREILEEELTIREAKVAQREQALKQKEAALLGAHPPVQPLIGLDESELDLSSACEEAKQGRGTHAAPSERKAYGKWLREHHPGRAPLKSFHVTLKKKNTEDRSFTLQAVDETDARRQAYQQAGLAQRTEGFNAIVQRV